ncbi:MAG TPA: hypothetical protein VE465_24555 [Streptosporangiaceae bacterium]|nr:hypothetical protein [Streptosporangiaceae bacterium]
MTTRTVPAWIRSVCDDLEDATGRRPQIEQQSKNKWRLTLENARVRLTMDWRRDGRGRFDREHTASTLQVDGKDRPTATSFEHFVRIFHNPDTEEDIRTLAPPMPPDRPLAEAPITVRLAYQSQLGRLRKLFGEHGTAQLRVGFDEHRGRWVIGADIAVSSFRDFFVRDGRRWIRPLRRHLVVVDGVDRTDQADKQLNKLISSMVASPPETDPDGAGLIGGASGAAGDPSKSRKGTILRT